MAEKPSTRKNAFNLIVLFLLITVTVVRFVPWTRSTPDMSEEEAALLLQGLTPEIVVNEDQVVQRETRRIPGRSVMGDRPHDQLETTMDALDDRMSDLELVGLGGPNEVTPPPEEPSDPDPETTDTTTISYTEPDDSPEDPRKEPPDPIPTTVTDTEATPTEPPTVAEVTEPPEAEPPPRGSGIWVREQRQGANPIQIEDHASINANQLSEMARVRNLSTNPQYAPPDFNIGAVGSGRMGVYVIADGNMVRQDGQIPAKTSPPNAWRLVDATQREVLWAPVP